jgi:teichuronic acid exporter
LENLKQKTYKAFTWDLIGRFGNQGIGFIISIFLARLLEPSDFGTLAMVTVVIGISAILQDFGLGSAIIQRKDVRDAHYGSIFYLNISIGLALTLLLFFSAGFIAAFYNRPDLKPIAQAISFTFLINSFCNVQRLYLKKNLIFGIIVRANITAIIVGGSIGIIMAFKGMGIWSLVAQQLISSITNNVYIYLANKWKPKLIFEWKALKELWGFGINMYLSGILDTIFRNLDSIVIGKLFSAQTLGFYYRANSLNSLVNSYTSGSLMSVLYPVLSKISENKEQYKHVINKAFHMLNFVTFGLLGILYLTAQDVIIVLFSAKWLPAVGYYKILILGGFIYPFSALLVNILSSNGNSKAFLRLEIYKKIVIGLNFIIGFWFGLEGFLYGMVIAYSIALILNIYFAAREMQLSSIWFYRIIYPYFFTGIFVTSSLFIIINKLNITSYWVHGFISFSLFVFCYIMAAKILKFKGSIILFEEIRRLELKQKIINIVKTIRKKRDHIS